MPKLHAPTEAICVPAHISNVDTSAPAYHETAHSVSKGIVYDAQAYQIGRVGQVYEYNENVVHDLEQIAKLYQAMQDTFQAQWKEQLDKLRKLDLPKE